MSRMSACKGVLDVAMCQRCDRAVTAAWAEANRARMASTSWIAAEAEKTSTGEKCPMFVEVRL